MATKEYLANAADLSLSQFSLVSGGPFHELLRWLGYRGKDGLPNRWAAYVLALLAWL